MKMKYLGFSKNVIARFKSYLIERKFRRNINTIYSNPLNLKCGISQGCILGPLLFLLHVNVSHQAVISDSLLCDPCIVF